MATPREIFDRDSTDNLTIHQTQALNDTSGNSAPVIAKVSLDFSAGVRYVYLYIEDSPMAAHAVLYYVRNIETALKAADGVEQEVGFIGTQERIRSKDLKFSGRVFAYTPSAILDGDKAILLSEAEKRGLALVIRDQSYLAQRIIMDAPQAFISHDSRDKEPFVSGLANTMVKMLCTVWYDEFSLVPGRSLRESIEDGLKKCRKCVLVLSPNFISNGGWTKAEFDSVFTREILEKKNVIIPIWHGVTKQQVYDYCPRLLDRIAVHSSEGVENVARKLVSAINHKDTA